MLKLGCIILTVWSGFQCIVSIFSLVISVNMKFAPLIKIIFTDQEISELDARLFPMTKSLAIMHNSGATVIGAFTLMVVWFALYKENRWAFLALLFIGFFSHIMWFLADSIIGNRTLPVNIILSCLFLTGIFFSGYGLFKS